MFYINSCKIAAAFPQANQKLIEYLQNRWNVPVAGCCREEQQLKLQGIAVVICHTCGSIMEESSMAEQVEYVWELLAKDPEFVFPDYGGEVITLQDCYMARERVSAQEAVRQLLTKMNFHIVELESNREAADFCGLRLQKVVPGNLQLAPQHFGHSEIAITDANYLQQYIKKYQTKKVVTYCGACYRALKQSGVPVVHLLELLFP